MSNERAALPAERAALVAHADPRVQAKAEAYLSERIAQMVERGHYGMIAEHVGGEDALWRSAAAKALRDAEGYWAERDAYEARVSAPIQAKREAIIAAGKKVCARCGGAGGARKWPGFVCYDCGGTGVSPR